MDNVVNLKDIRILLEAGQTIDQINADLQDALDRLLCTNVKEFDGRMLRKTRDQILYFQRMLVVCSPEAKELIEDRIRTLSLDKPLTEAEAEAMGFEACAPIFAQVSVRFAR